MLRRVRERVFRRRKSAGVDPADDQNLSDFSSSCSPDRDSVAGSLSDDEDEDVEGDFADAEGPTLIAVDDGKGGIKHVRVARPPDSQSERSLSGESGSAVVGNNSHNLFHLNRNSQQHQLRKNESVSSSIGVAAPATRGALKSPAPTTVVVDGHGIQQQQQQPPTVADMIKKEFKGKHLLQMESSDAEKLRKRIVSKKGVVHIGRSHLDRKQQRRILYDFFNTMLDLKWRYVLLIFSLSFILSWLFFAVIWFLIMYLHGDFEEGHLPDQQEKTGWKPCVWAIHDFASCYLFSVETQHTIGYGSRQTTEACPEAVFVMSLQSVVGVMIQACMVGTIFAKLSRPKRRAETLLFSRNAVVLRRDGHLCLCVRMANMRSSHLVECHVRAILISRKVTEEGEVIPYHQTELTVGTDLEGEEDTVFFIWPTTIVHRINEESPFYNMSARDFVKKRYELIITLEGIVEPTGMSIQARTSYLPHEILWGYRFVNILNYRRKEGLYKVDYGSFNTLFKVDTPTCSARLLKEQQDLLQQQQSPRKPSSSSATSSPLPPHHASQSLSRTLSSPPTSSPGSSNSTLTPPSAAAPSAAAVQRLKAQENHLAPPPKLLPQIRFVSDLKEEEQDEGGGGSEGREEKGLKNCGKKVDEGR